MEDIFNTAHEQSSMSGFTPTGDITLDSLLHEVDVAMQDVRDFTLPNDMVENAVNGASDFFLMIHPAIVDSEATGVWTSNPTTYIDDVVGFSRQQMIEMGVYGQDALDLVMTHECGHRALQAIQMDPWTEELACDYLAGIRAGLQHKDVEAFENSLANTQASPTHPVGSLRVDFIEYGKHVAEQMQASGIEPTFNNCMEAFNRHLTEEGTAIAQAHEQVALPNQHGIEHTDRGQIAFTGKYTETEIRRLEENVNSLKRDLSYADSSVHSHENRVNNADTKKGHENGNYAHEVSELNQTISKRNSIASQLKDAQSKLNNAR
jgi:hypothetical protein